MMPTTSSRLDTIQETLRAVSEHDVRARLNELMDLMRVRQLTEEDFTRLVPECIDIVQRDIIREAMLLRQEIDNGDNIRIFGYCGLTAALIMIPPDDAVPSVILEQVRELRSNSFPMPIGLLDTRAYPYYWIWRVLYLLALGDDRGDVLRSRFHHGEFAHLSANDQREGEPVCRDLDAPGNVEVANALVEALTGHPPASTTGLPVRRDRIADPMQYVV